MKQEEKQQQKLIILDKPLLTYATFISRSKRMSLFDSTFFLIDIEIMNLYRVLQVVSLKSFPHHAPYVIIPVSCNTLQGAADRSYPEAAPPSLSLPALYTQEYSWDLVLPS